MAYKTQNPPILGESEVQLSPGHIFSGVLAGGRNDTLDERDFKERHGDQYHLRHHLSGCSQTLHVIDFAKDFSSPVEEPSFNPPVLKTELTPLAQSVYAATMADEIAVNTALIQTQIAMQSEQAVTVDEQQFSSLTHQPQGEIHLEHSAILPEHTTQRPQPLTVTQADDQLTVSDSSEVVAPLIADFNNSSLDGWQLQGELQADDVLENGELHFRGEMLQGDEPLLSRSLNFTEGQRYQFEMAVRSSEDGEAPQFHLLVNGEEIAMQTSREGEGFVVRGEFTASSSDAVDVGIALQKPAGLASSLWLDDVILQPALAVTPPVVDIAQEVGDYYLPTELSLSFENLNQPALEAPTIMPQVMPTLSQVLITDEKPLFAELPASLPEQDVTLENIGGESDSGVWNQEVIEPDMPASLLAAEPLLTPDYFALEQPLQVN